jgi:hypothetical protein
MSSALASPEEMARAVRFVKTAKQREQVELMLAHEMVMAEGGARSGKTFGFVRQILARGIMRPSRHLAARFRAKHAKASLMLETVPAVIARCFPGLKHSLNKSDGIFEFESAGGRRSELWIAGVDDASRMDKILGKEFSTIFLNECSQIPFDAVGLLRTRLAEKSGLALRMFFDQNPPPKSHWTWRLFHNRQTPDRQTVDWDIATIRMNPTDNAENLPAQTLRILETLPKRQRQRFWEGLYLEDVEGALWTDAMLNLAKLREPGEIVSTVVAVDPSVSNRADADECGIVVASADHTGGGILHEDASAKMTTETWARRAVALYHERRANCIVAEVNQGGQLVVDAIKNVDPGVPVRTVHAAKSKYARAEPVAQLFEPEQRRITIEGNWPELEEELTTYVPRDAKFSPNRLDAMVWAFTHLLIDEQSVTGIEFI